MVASTSSWSLPSLDSLTYMDVLKPFIQLSYPVETPKQPDSFHNSTYYSLGPLDACIVVTCMAVFAVLREIVRLHIMTPFANKWLFGNTQGYVQRTPTKGAANGVNGKPANGYSNGHSHQRRIISAKNRVRQRNVVRFAEQGWAIVYATFSWCYGVYIHFSLPASPWNLDYLWLDVPHTPLAGPIKLYYLGQCAFWIHQLLILHAEEHRKDHYQMMSHHFITIFLVFTSYQKHMTRVGCLIMVLMDFCDIILPLAKMLRYLEMPTACDGAFVVFLVSWFLTRHVGFCLVIRSTWITLPLIRPNIFDPTLKDHVSIKEYYMFNICLATLEVLMVIWFYAIVKIAWNFLRGAPPEDTRSDEELPDSSDEETDEKKDR